MSSTEERNRAIVEFQLIDQLASDTRVRLATVEAAILEHQSAIDFLDELKKTSGKMETLVQLGAGGYIRGEIPVTGTIEVNIGAGVVMRKNIEEGEQVMHRRKETFERAREAYRQRLQEYLTRAEQLRGVLERGR